ncbi:MAG: UTP--glucose-1-phosphate uridylyltransferase [Parcubacteria group bacterium Gr01-1014_66]|nr:MAG: UTP--glucose-1-phosphate uridylyltransferase [Parcubacteria group bacterium Gr01-1014_66]
MSSQVTKAIIAVGGFGTRFLPATKAQPKEMLPLVDKPVIQYIVEEAVASGITDIIFVTGRGKRAIEDHFDYAFELEYFLRERGKKDLAEAVHTISSLARFAYIRQGEPKGPGHAILQARHLIGDEPVAILWADDVVDAPVPCLQQLCKVFARYQKPVLALERVPYREVSRYGIVGAKKIDTRTYQVTQMIEKPRREDAPSNLVSIGKYICTPQLLDCLESMKEGPGGEYFLTGAFQLYLQGGGDLYGYEYEGVRYDCGEKLGFLKAVVHAGMVHPEVGPLFKKYLKEVVSERSRKR